MCKLWEGMVGGSRRLTNGFARLGASSSQQISGSNPLTIGMGVADMVVEIVTGLEELGTAVKHIMARPLEMGSQILH